MVRLRCRSTRWTGFARPVVDCTQLCRQEAECFAEAAALDTHKALVHIFFAQRSTKKVGRRLQLAVGRRTHFVSDSGPVLWEGLFLCCSKALCKSLRTDVRGASVVKALILAHAPHNETTDGVQPCWFGVAGGGDHGRGAEAAADEVHRGAGRRPDGQWHRHGCCAGRLPGPPEGDQPKVPRCACYRPSRCSPSADLHVAVKTFLGPSTSPKLVTVSRSSQWVMQFNKSLLPHLWWWGQQISSCDHGKRS